MRIVNIIKGLKQETLQKLHTEVYPYIPKAGEQSP